MSGTIFNLNLFFKTYLLMGVIPHLINEETESFLS